MTLVFAIAGLRAASYTWHVPASQMPAQAMHLPRGEWLTTDCRQLPVVPLDQPTTDNGLCSTAMPRVPTQRYVLFATLATLGFVADLVTKNWVFSIPELRAEQVVWLWPGHVGIQLSRNWGALFGIGQDMVWLFAALSIVAAVAIPVGLFRYQAARDLWLTVALGLVMGGVLGNLYDRLGLSGEIWRPRGESREALHAVRDWVLWQVNGDWRWPNFNIADSLLVVGATLLFFRLVRKPSENSPYPERAEATSYSLPRQNGG